MRATFFAIGLFVTLWGISLLFIDKVALKSKADEAQPNEGFRAMIGMRNEPYQQQKVLDPPDWVAFSLLSVGSVTMLYSFALPRKKQG